MTLSKKQMTRLENIIRQAELILREAGAPVASAAAKPEKRKPANDSGRRSRADAAVLRKEILAARKKGARVAVLAEKFGVTPSYIYQMR